MDREKPPLRFADLHGSGQTPSSVPPGSREHELLLQEYRPWRKIRRIARDLGMTPEAAWATVKWSRLFCRRPLEVSQPLVGPFSVCLGAHVMESLHRIDRATGGGGAAVLTPGVGELGDEGMLRRLRIKTLMDEAAESSLIEGAATTRKDAVELLRSGREPANKSERMVVNNYIAMQKVKEWLGRPLSAAMLLELQTVLTSGTLERPDEAGRFRRPDEPVRVVDERTNETIFEPPAAADLPTRLDRVCAFANAAHDRGERFLHPIVKACILHFLIGYEHPFCDGNGRTARAVFYWFALRHGYSIFEFASISELIRKGYASYPQAYLDSECDEGDLTYFVLHQLRVIEQSLDKLSEHLKHEQEKIKRSESMLRVAKDLNLRQRLLLEHGLRRPLTHYTVKSHMNSNGIVAATARADLEDLARRRMLAKTSSGKQVIYMIAPGLEDRLRKRGALP